MKSKKTGISMGGTIEYTRTKDKQIFIFKKDNEKKKRAKVCIDCENNQEGFCTKHKNWCGKVNYICLGTSDPYKNISKPKKNKITHKSISKRQVKELKKQCNSCIHSNGSGHCKKFKGNFQRTLLSCKLKHFQVDNELGQVVKPRFDTTGLVRKK